MDAMLSFLREKGLLYGLVAVAIVAAFVLFSGDGDVKEEFVTVERGPFVQQVAVSGKVVAAKEVDLGFSQSGRVAHVYAEVGDEVKVGAALAELENGDLRAAVLQKEAALETQQAKLAALRQGTRPEEIAVAESSVESNAAALAQADQALLDELRDAYRSAEDAVYNDLDQILNNPRTADPQVKFLVSDTQLEVDLETGRPAVEPMLVAWQSELAARVASDGLLAAASTAQGDLARVATLLSKANAALNRAIATPTISQSTIDGYITTIGTARTSINTEIAALTTAVTAEKNAAAALATSQKNLALKQAGTIQADIDAQAAQVKAAEADLASARANLAKTIMHAPFAGVVAKMDLKVGGVASASVSGVSMISTGAFQIESYVPEVNIALIAVGDEAEVTLDAYGEDVLFGASVVTIDPAETIRDGVSTYRTTLEFIESDSRIRSGMTANVTITTDERDGVLAIPVGVVATREGKKYVRVKEGEETFEREVTTGETSSLGMVEVLSGLSEGDVVVVP